MVHRFVNGNFENEDRILLLIPAFCAWLKKIMKSNINIVLHGSPGTINAQYAYIVLAC